jgi:putative phosphoesterase
MKLGLLGDIHGNSCALRAVLSAAETRGVEKLLVTGDLVGYYFHPAEVLAVLAEWEVFAVRGNHEDMLAKARTDSAFLSSVEEKYGSGLRCAMEQLQESELDELCGLPYSLELNIDGCKILLCHGSPWDPDQYIYPNSEPALMERFVERKDDVIVLGHTHYPMRREIGKTLIVNPGSVGQPRNRKPGAQWALLDTVNRTVEFFNEAYDSAPLVEESLRRHPGLPHMADVLTRS